MGNDDNVDDNDQNQQQHRLTLTRQHLKYNKRLRKQTKCGIPWKDIWELSEVGKSIYTAIATVSNHNCTDNNDDSVVDNTTNIMISLEDAFDMIDVWKARAGHIELPHAIESTAHLAKIYIRDSSLDGQPKQNSLPIDEKRLSYSTAIIRCINGFADTLQQNRYVAAPISILANQLGIPTWIVDIRHEASHNALPHLSELRLGATTLLEFMKNVYWIPICGPNKLLDDSPSQPVDTQEQQQPKAAIDYLLDYQSCFEDANPASKLLQQQSTVSTTTDIVTVPETATTIPTQTGRNNNNNNNNSRNRNNCKVDKKASSKRTATTTAEDETPFDMFFGHDRNKSEVSDDDDDDEDSYDEDPLVGNVWGSAVGTNINRFALLGETKKKKKTNKKEVLPPKKTPKKKKKKNIILSGDKSPVEYAQLFVKHISPQEGFMTALTFLVWGRNDTGEGVLLMTPSDSSSQAEYSDAGVVNKSYKRYLPLIQTIGCQWQKFASILVVHLIDYVLKVEEEEILDNNSEVAPTNRTTTISPLLDDAASSISARRKRKLYFASSWIRFLFSKQFLIKLDPELKKEGSMKANPTTDSKRSQKQQHLLEFAPLSYLKSKYEYPLNSLCDHIISESSASSPSPYTAITNKSDNKGNHLDFRHTSRTILSDLETILGKARMSNYGVTEEPDEFEQQREVVYGPMLPSGVDVDDEEKATEEEHDNLEEAGGEQSKDEGNGKSQMSLVAMEALLTDKDDESRNGGIDNSSSDGALKDEDFVANKNEATANSSVVEDNGPTLASDRQNVMVEDESEKTSKRPRPTWIRCATWEPCSIGTLPGRPV